METVTVSRAIPAPVDRVREAMWDLEPFMAAAGFTDVAVDVDDIRIVNRVGIFEIELELEVVDRPGAALAYVQREGIFSAMVTEYAVRGVEDGCRVSAETEFELAAPFVGPLFDATVVTRQRRREFEGQFDYLEAVA